MQNAPSSILIVDHAQEARFDLAGCLMARGDTVATTSPGDEACSLLSRQRFDILLADVGPDGEAGLDRSTLYRKVKRYQITKNEACADSGIVGRIGCGLEGAMAWHR